MRLSSSLVLIFAALTVANAVAVDTVSHPKHNVLGVKNGAAHVNAVDLAKVKLNRQHGLSLAARSAVDVAAKVDLKQVASVVHTLSASLEHETELAHTVLRTKGHKHAVTKAKSLLYQVKDTLSTAKVDLHGLSKSVHANAAVAVQRRHLAVDLQAVAYLLVSANIGGVSALVNLLGGLSIDAVLSADVLVTLAAKEVLQVVHDVADIASVLTAVLAVDAAAELLVLFSHLEHIRLFVQALVEIKSFASLTAAVDGGACAIANVEGAAKLSAYIDKFGIDVVAQILKVAGVEAVLQAIVQVPASVGLFVAVNAVADVHALVSGIATVGVSAFVPAIQAVADVSLLAGTIVSVQANAAAAASAHASANASANASAHASAAAAASAHVSAAASAQANAAASAGASAQCAAGVKRSELLGNVEDAVSGVTSDIDLDRLLNLKRAELLGTAGQTVSGVTSGLPLVSGVTSSLPLDKVLNLKRALAQISALPDSKLVSIEQVLKRDVLDKVDLDAALHEIDAVEAAVLRRSVAAIADVTDDEISDLLATVDVAAAVQKRTILPMVETAAGTAQNRVGAAPGAAVDLVGSVPVAAEGLASGALGVVAGAPKAALGSVSNVAGIVKRDILPGVAGSTLGSATSLVQGGPLADVAGANLGLLDVNRLLATKRSSLLSSVDGTLSNVDLVKVLPALKRAIAQADVAALTAPTASLTAALLPRHVATVTLLSDAIDTLSTTLASVLSLVVDVYDVVEDVAIEEVIKSEVVPLVADVVSELHTVVGVVAPKLSGKVVKVAQLADKTVKSLP